MKSAGKSLKELSVPQKKIVFALNLFLVVYVIISFFFNFSLASFFYINILVTLLVSYIIFKTSKELSRLVIITNLFILFYFFYPQLSSLFFLFFNNKNEFFILFYVSLLGFVFLLFSGYHKELFKNFTKVSPSVVGITALLGLCFGVLFYVIKEPIPSIFSSTMTTNIPQFTLFLAVSAFFVALSEQLVFTGFLFSVYRKLTQELDAYLQTAVMFVLFHLLRFKLLVVHYYKIFATSYLYYISAYYLLLFIFLLVAIYLRTFTSKKYNGLFTYTILFHFFTDFSLLLLYLLAKVLQG
ncbi:hypothetical protein H6501_03910 [Candidatus Woesearchaeota archaeon]|nr:hypothetical protein [Nanoarchaeota archaeon]MCB9370717.1 hypothetical protein [Candidatus Woesearchaeota archaeon]USN43793.1 MAG: hypothetical protein H6500_05385 [Candidatus Woesearchaeota archaeon]